MTAVVQPVALGMETKLARSRLPDRYEVKVREQVDQILESPCQGIQTCFLCGVISFILTDPL